MAMRSLRLFAAITMAGSWPSAVAAQEQQTYDRVLDRLFPVNEKEAIGQIVVRILPALKGSESQLVLRLASGAGSTASYCKARQMISSAIKDETGEDWLEKLVDRVKVDCHELPVAAGQVVEWYREILSTMFTRLPKDWAESHRRGSALIALDGARYKVKISHGQNDIALDLGACDAELKDGEKWQSTVCGKIDQIIETVAPRLRPPAENRRHKIFP
jgi:hypothetical protein